MSLYNRERHVQHEPLGEFEGHPILTPLRDANEHLRAALGYRHRGGRVGINREHFAQEIALLRAGLDVLESDYSGGSWQ